MAPSARTFLEFAIPIIAVYLFIGAPALPSIIADTIRSVFNPDGETCPTSKPQSISQDNLAWALETLAIPPAEQARCPAATHTTHIYSADPLVLYLDGFVSDEEIERLAALARPLYRPASIFSTNGAGETNNTSIRRSEKAPLPRDDALVPCIEERARALQGWRADVFVEKLWAQRYGPGGHYAPHYDWGSDDARRGGRVSSFMVWLNDGFTGGGTNFPRLSRQDDPAWCERIECNANAAESGTTFLPRRGAAVYWENFRRSDGVGYDESWHAGLPVVKGEKIALNIWSWWQPGLGEAMNQERERRQREPLE